jgi:phosphatidylserine decarboxylase
MVKTGWNFVLPFGLLGAALLWQGYPVLGWLCLALAAFCANFFRNPSRAIPSDARYLVSPADGKVLAIEAVEDPYVGKAMEIRIFLNVFNVHTQRSPFVVPAKVEGTRFFAGKFLAASAPKASLENEQHWIRLKNKKGDKVVVKQIAGLIARRIVSWVRPGDEVAGGQHVGLIQFGSQVDLVLPRKWKLLVKVGDKVVGGETLMADKPTPGRR